jgi:hypothetical protein
MSRTPTLVSTRSDDRVEIMLPCCFTKRVVDRALAEAMATDYEQALAFLNDHKQHCPNQRHTPVSRSPKGH